MTTIAIKDGMVAADTMQCGSFIDPIKAEKIFRIDNANDLLGREGSHIIIGGSGSMSEIQGFKYWVINSGLIEEYVWLEEANFFILDEKGVWSYESTPHPVLCGSTFAFGSGDGFAMGAMKHGASPEEAVRVAMELCPWTGGDVIQLSL